MKRSPELASLSHDHPHALDVARRLRRATPADLDEALAYLRSFWAERGATHFALEERALTPELCPDDMRWRVGVAMMRAQHEEIRRRAEHVTDLVEANTLGDLLHDHVRFEERELFGILEKALSADELARVGQALLESH